MFEATIFVAYSGDQWVSGPSVEFVVSTLRAQIGPAGSIAVKTTTVMFPDPAEAIEDPIIELPALARPALRLVSSR